MCIGVTNCRKGKAPAMPMFRWTSVNPAFDSTVLRLENAYIHAMSFPSRDSLTHSLDSLSEPYARAQRDYWLARLARNNENYPAALFHIQRGLDAIDSAEYSYEWARLISIKASLPIIPVRLAYDLSAANLRYFEATRDTFMLGSTLMRLGTVMWSINDTVPAAVYYRKADTIYTEHGPEEYRLSNLVNIANTLVGPEAEKKRDSIMAEVRHNVLMKSDTSLYIRILKNTYHNTGKFDYLRRAYIYALADTAHPSMRPGVEAAMAEFFLENEMSNDSTFKYGRRAFADIDKVSDHMTRAMIFNIMAYAAYIDREIDPAIEFYHEFLTERLAMEQERFSLETTKAEYRQGFEKARQEEALRHSHERMMWITILLLACSGAAVIAVILYFRVQKVKMNRRQAELELMQNRNYLSACALAIDEKNRIIDSLGECVEKMHTEGKLAGSQAREITATIKRSVSTELEMETFTELHKKLHPEFISRLKNDFPELTESQLRHAAYIAMGLTPKQIATALNIEYDSVKKSRTRLRQRMGLPAGSSLEDTLRVYSCAGAHS